MSLLQTKALPALEGERVAKVKSYEEVENKEGGYIRLVLALKDRDYTYCVFPSQVEYIASCLQSQLGDKSKEYSLEQLLKLAKRNEFKVWFSYNKDIQKMNVAFHQSSNVVEDIEEI